MRRCAEMLLLVAMTVSMLFADGGASSRPSPQRTIVTKTGEHQQISDKGLEPMVQSCPHKHDYFRQVLIVVLPVLALLVLAAVWLWTTRIQVRHATAELRSEIDERRKAEDEVDRLARFPAEDPNPVFRVDSEGIVLYANQAAKELLASWQCQPGLHMPEGCCYNRIQHALSTGLPEQGECQAGGRIFAMSVAPIVEEGYANLYGLDVTDRSKAAESLQQEIQRHKALMDVSLDGIAIINQEHQVIEANRCFAEMLGYSTEEVLTLHTWDWQADVTEEEIRSAYVDLTQSHSRFETHHRRKDGTVFPVEVSLSGTNIGGENLVYTVTRDITKRKQSEKSLRESESKYRTVVEQASDAIFLHDRNGKILDVNRKACENLGYTREELLNTPIQEVDPESAAKGKINADTWNRILAGEQIRFESHQTRKDGSVFPVEVTLGAVTLPVGRGILGIVRDITERKQAEETLRESEDRYHSLIEHAGDAIVLFDHTWRILDVNRKACENLGYTREELLSMVVMTMDPYACRVGLVSEEQWKRISAGEQFHFESYQTRKDGSVFPVEVTLGSVHLAGGNVFLGISRDVTERKQAEEALQKLNAELEQRVAQRTGELENRVNEVEQLNRAMLNLSDDLRKTNQNLEQTAKGLEVANQELEAFSYSVSHDLRSPLRAMDGFSLAVLEDYSSRLDDTGKDYLNRIRTAAQHMGRLIDAILELSRASRVGMETQKVDLSALASQAVEELRHLEPDRHVDVVITPEMSCRGDENLLRQLLANLLGNAWKFTTPREQGWIEFTVLSPEQATAIQKPGQMVYVVRDNGVGFDMHYASKLFTAFQRLHSREEFPGTGVGLATVKRIISRHGGEVWAESVLGQGASIYFTLGLS